VAALSENEVLVRLFDHQEFYDALKEYHEALLSVKRFNLEKMADSDKPASDKEYETKIILGEIKALKSVIGGYDAFRSLANKKRQT